MIELDVGGTAPSLEFKRIGGYQRYKINLKGKDKGFYFGTLEPGDYQVTQVHAPYYGLPFKRDYRKDEQWRFSIAPGKTNYLGKLTISKTREMSAVFVALNNRLAGFILKHQKKHRALLKQYPLVSGFIARDKFQRQLRGE